MKYELNELYTFNEFAGTYMAMFEDGIYSTNGMMFGLEYEQVEDLLNFLCGVIYGYFYDSIVAYDGDVKTDVKSILEQRLGYDIALKLPYWYRKYNYILKLLTETDFSLMQTSKVTSSSNDLTNSAGGSLQKTATTPTGVSADSVTDSIDITMNDGANEIETTGFVDKYTNAQQKYANASRVEGERSGEILREGSVDELLKILEKLPSSFGDEINRELSKHFLFVYEC